jgi:hypothetical protein
VYVLGCGDVYYVGIDFAPDVCSRIRAQFRGEGAGFTEHFRPTRVSLMLSAPSRAAEAYVYYALLESKPDVLIGGWTQTSWNPSPLVCLLTREARANLSSQCFGCGQKAHFARDCPSEGRQTKTCYYPCKAKGCDHVMYLTSRGQTPLKLCERAKALAVAGDGDGHDKSNSTNASQAAPGGNNQATALPALGSGSSSSSSGSSSCPPQTARTAPEQPVQGAPKRLRLTGKQPRECSSSASCAVRPAAPDVSFDSACFAARKHPREGGQEELVCLRDMVRLMKTKKSMAAEKHLDERLPVWKRRYSRQDPRDCEGGLTAFRSRTGGGLCGAGVTSSFARDIWNELAK